MYQELTKKCTVRDISSSLTSDNKEVMQEECSGEQAENEGVKESVLDDVEEWKSNQMFFLRVLMNPSS